MLTNHYLSTGARDERSGAHRDRNSPKLDFRSLLASRRPGEVSKITLLSGCRPAVSERNDSRRLSPAETRVVSMPRNSAAWKLAGASR